MQCWIPHFVLSVQNRDNDAEVDPGFVTAADAIVTAAAADAIVTTAFADAADDAVAAVDATDEGDAGDDVAAAASLCNRSLQQQLRRRVER